MFMLAGLERAGGRYRALGEVLCIYNSNNPLADNKANPGATACTMDFLHRPPLEPLP